jgi:small-conductance mechanosensitive channel/CRP-like cAMP-binding protein
MIGSALPVICAAALLLGLLSLPKLPRGWQLVVDLVLVAGCSLLFLVLGGSPLRPLTARPAPALWAEALALAWWVFAVRLVAGVIRLQLGHARRSRETRLVSDLLAGGVYVCGALIILNDVLRVPIGGVVATSGIIAIVLGLALQNTLGDVFAGIAVGVEKPFSPGDRIRLGEELEGRVVQINWRSIRIRTDEDDLAIIPNSTVAKAQIVNRSVPNECRATHLDVAANAAADPRQVQTRLADALLLIDGILTQPAASVLLLRVGLRAAVYRLVFTVADAGALGRIKSDLLIQAQRQLRHAGLLPRAPDASTAEPAGDAGLRVLRDTPVFDSLDVDQLASLALRLRPLTVKAGERLFTQGEVDARVYMVDRGVIELSRTEGGGAALGRISVGEYIGEIGLLTGAPRPVSATALTDCALSVLDKAALQPLLSSSPELAAAFEASVRRGQALLDRDEAARAMSQPGEPTTLLARIRSFFSVEVGEARR